MPSKHQFSAAERFGVWQAHGGKCFWCHTPIEYQHTTVDHVIPEEYLTRPNDFASIKEEYALAATFQINDFVNWVPAHANCNTSKGTRVFKSSPALIKTLDDVEKKATIASETCAKVLKDKSKAKIIAKIENAVESGLITKTELTDLFSGLEAVVKTEHNYMHILPGWRVEQKQGRLAIVSRGDQVGMTSADSNPDMSWLCPNCLCYGPWNGVICLTCGMRSAPE